MQEPRFADAPLNGRHFEAVLLVHIQAHAGALRTGHDGFKGCFKAGGIDVIRKGAQGGTGCGHNAAKSLLKGAHSVIFGLGSIASRQDIMELVEKDALPGDPELIVIVVHPGLLHSEGGQCFAREEPVFADTVRQLYLGLGGIAAGEGGAQLAGQDGEVVLKGSDGFEIALIGREEDRGGHRPTLHIDDALDVLTGRSATVVTDTVDLHHIPDPVLCAEFRHLMKIHGQDPVIIPKRLVQGQDLGAGGALPPVEISPVQTSAMVEEFDAACVQNCGDVGAVTEGIGMEVQLNIFKGDTELLVEVLLGIEDVPGHALEVGHILVQFDPTGSCKFEAALFDAFLHPAE